MELMINAQLEKWSARDIRIVKARYKSALSKQNPRALDRAAFLALFPALKQLPLVQSELS